MFFKTGEFMDFSNKKILVAGAGRSGIASAAVLLKHGAEVTLADEKPANSFILPESLYGVKTRIGEEFLSDGSDFDLIVTSPGIPLFAPIFSIAKQRNIPVIGEIELGYLLCNCKIAAVTGTNGKTTTTTLLGEILAAHYDGSKTAGNIGVSFAGTAEEIPEDAYAAVEISSFQLETIKNFHPNVAACLNVTPDHLNRHGTIEVYAATKKREFENQT
jgi:UDP-N-acetylmuramoylalanine--D-glutamate ligase